MKIREIIEEFIPCKLCGNRDIKNFEVVVGATQKPIVICGECEKKYVSERAYAVIQKLLGLPASTESGLS